MRWKAKGERLRGQGRGAGGGWRWVNGEESKEGCAKDLHKVGASCPFYIDKYEKWTLEWKNDKHPRFCIKRQGAESTEYVCVFVYSHLLRFVYLQNAVLTEMRTCLVWVRCPDRRFCLLAFGGALLSPAICHCSLCSQRSTQNKQQWPRTNKHMRPQSTSMKKVISYFTMYALCMHEVYLHMCPLSCPCFVH